MIIAHSLGLRRAIEDVERVSALSLPVLLVGETGTGKEVLARHLHDKSGRPGPFVPVNCGCLPQDLADSLLFGHRRGAFTGAIDSRPGYVERAHRGTLFLDEIDALPLAIQIKLLRVLDDCRVTRLNDDVERAIDFRLVSASQGRLPVLLRTGAFREDLYARIRGAVVRLPPLRERREDIVPLAEFFAASTGRTLGMGVEQVLIHYSWPHNVRELKLVIERSCTLVENGTLPPDAIAEAIGDGAMDAAEDGVKTQWVLDTCRRESWDAAAAARALGVHRATLNRWLRAIGVSLREMKMSQDVARRRAKVRDTERLYAHQHETRQ